ncbi:MAG: hotdog fold thioesterase [Flavobacteriales bacterium]
MIWKKAFTLPEINSMNVGNMGEFLEIEFTEIGDDHLTARMPVTSKVKQPAGLLHGGASVVLAETVGSVAANLCVDMDAFLCVGLEINANHLRAVKDGYVYGTARPLHVGVTTQVWNIEIRDGNGRLTCASRITMACVPKKGKTLDPLIKK